MAASPLTLATLRHRIAVLEGGGRGGPAAVVAFGVAALDAHLPWRGLPCASLHEVVDVEQAVPRGGHGGAATAFAAALLGRRQRTTGKPVFWIAAHESLCGHGLAAYGLAAEALVLVRAAVPADVLWAMEEALREPGVGAVLGEVAAVDLAASRRLQLAAEAGGGLGLVLRPDAAGGAASSRAPSVSVTRWRIRTAASGPARPAAMVGPARWQVELLRCRGGTPGQWLVEWDDAQGGFAVAAPLSDRPAVPAAGSPGEPAWPAPRRLAG